MEIVASPNYYKTKEQEKWGGGEDPMSGEDDNLLSRKREGGSNWQ